MKGKLIAVAACALLLNGCVNGYAKFYHQAPGATPDLVAARRVAPAPAVPQIERWSGSPEDAYKHFAQMGYLSIGYSSFNGGGGATEQQALDQGKKVGADIVVVLAPHYTGTRSTVVPIVTPTSNTSVTNATATAYGAGGTTTAYGTATTTSYGSQTNFVPISTDRFDFGAIYLVKARMSLGLLFRDLNDEERQALGSNSGVVVTTVVDGTPAFAADILPGDIVTTVDGERTSVAMMNERMPGLHGKTITLTIHRASGDLQKTVTLNN